MLFDQRALSCDLCGGNIGDYLHRMGIAHRQRADDDFFAANFKRVSHRLSIATKRNLARCKARRAHIDGDFAVVLQPWFDNAVFGFDLDFGFVRQALLAHEAHEAARAVAALLDLAAVGIEYAVTKIHIGLRGALDQQNLVAANAEVPVGNGAQLCRVQIHPLCHAVEHDKIVAEAVHFGEG